MEIDEKIVKKTTEILKSNPKDVSAFKSLEEQYFLSNNWRKLTELYDFRADIIQREDTPEAAKLYFKSGEIYEKHLGEKEKAILSYQKAFTLQPRKAEYGDILASFYQSEENYTKCLEILRRQLDLFSEINKKISILLKMAYLFKDKLQNKTEAKKSLSQILELQKSQEEAIHSLEALYTEDKQWEELVRLYQYILPAFSDVKYRMNFLEKCALISKEQLQDSGRAADFYQQILTLSPHHSSTLKSLENIYLKLEQWNKLIEIFLKELPLPEFSSEKQKILLCVAEIWLQKLNNQPEAVKYYEEALQLQEEDSILKILENIHLAQKDWKKLSDIYQKQAKRTKDQEEQISLYVKIAEIAKNRLNHLEMATQWYNAAYQKDKKNLSFLRILQDLYKEQRNFKELVQKYYEEIALLSDEQEKILTYYKIASVYKSLNDLKSCANTHEEVLHKYPSYRSSLVELKALYTALEDYDSVIQTIQRQIALSEDPSEKIALYFQMADTFKEKLNKEAQAIECYIKILEIKPERLDIWQILYEYYKRNKSYDNLILCLENIAYLDKEKAEESFLEMAFLYLQRLENTEKALESFEKVFSLNSRNLTAIRSLAALYQSREEWEKYIQSVLRQIELSIENKERITLHLSLCSVYKNLKMQDEEERHFGEILKIEPDHRVAFESLKSLYESQPRWDKLLSLLEKEVQVFPLKSEELFSLYHNIAKIAEEKVQNREKAVQYYEKARHLYPNEESSLSELQRMYEIQKDYKKWIHILESRACLCSDISVEKEYYYKIGILWQEKLQNDTEAIVCFSKVISLDNKHFLALKKLQSLYEKREDYENLAGICWQMSYIAEKTQDKISLMLSCAKIWDEKLHDSIKASQYYSQIILIDESNAFAIERLLKLYRQQEKWADLARIYEKKIAITESSEETIILAFELGSIYRDYLQAFSKAIEIYQDILSLDFSELQAIYALKELYVKLSNFEALEQTMKMECSLVEDKEKKKSLLIQMAQICEDKIYDFPRAIGHYKSLLQYYPEHLDSIRSLRRLYYKIQNHEDVVATLDMELKLVSQADQMPLLFEKSTVAKDRLQNFDIAVESLEKVLAINSNNIRAYKELIEIHSQRENYEKWIDILQRQLPICPVDKQKEICLKCATLLEEKLQNDAKAKSCLQDALRLDTTYLPARNALEILHTRLREWPDLLRLYQEEISFCKDNLRIVELHYRIGKILETSLNMGTKAIPWYLKVLSLEPQNILAIKSLEDIYRIEKQDKELWEIYQRELTLPDLENERKIALHLESAELQRYKLGDIGSAIKSYQAVLEMSLPPNDPDNLIAIRGLEDLYREKQQYKDLQAMFFKELELQKDRNRLIEVHLELACLMEEELDDIDVAIEHFYEAHLSRPQNLVILRRLKTLLRISQRWENYAEIVEKEILLCDRKPDLLPLHEDLLNIYDIHLQRVEKAIFHGEKILQFSENHLNTIIKLEALYKKSGQLQKMVDSYLKEAEIINKEGNEERLFVLFLESANILAKDLKNLDLAKSCYQKAIKLDPTNKDALSGMVNVLTDLQDWEYLIKVYELAAQLSKNSIEVLGLYLKIGELWEKELHNDNKALLAYQIAYCMDSKNYMAVNGMRKIFERQKRWGDAIEMLSGEVYLVDEKKKPPLYLKMGEYWEEKLDMPHQALTCYLKVMGHGFHRPTAERIMRIQEKVGDYQGFVEILEKDLRVTEKNEDLLPKLLSLATIQWKHLNYPEMAVETFSKVLKIDSKQMDALNALDELLTNQKKWRKLITILIAKKENLSDPKQLINVYLKIAEIYDKELHTGNLAIKYYEQAMELSPHDINIIHTLQRLYYDWGFFKKLIGLYQKEILLINDKERIIYLYSSIGETWEKRLFEDDQAIKSYERILELDPGNIAAVKSLSNLYKRYQAWEKLIVVYNILIEEAVKKGNTKDQISYLMSLGAVYQDHLKKAETAIEVFKKILDIDPDHKETLQSLDQLYKSLGKLSELANLIHQKLLFCEDNQERLELYVHIGMLYEKELDDPDKAIEAFESALALNNQRLDILKSLDWLYLRKKNWEKLIEICMQEIELSPDPEEKAEICYRVGILKRDRFHEYVEAKRMFLESIDYQPALRKSLKALTGLSILNEDWTQAVKYISMEINHIKDPSEKVEALNDLGSLYQNKLKLIQKSKEVFQMALEIDPQSTIAIEAMAEIYFIQNEPAHAEPLFGRLVLLVDKSKVEKLSIIYYKWGFMAEKLSRKDDAIVRYSNALKIKEDNLDALVALGSLYFERAQWGFDKTQWQEALDIYQRAYQHPSLEDGRKDIVRRLAIIYEKLGQNDSAIEWYLKVIADIPEDSESIQALSKLYLKKGEDEEALKYLQTTVRSDFSSFQERRSALLTIAEVQTRLNRHREAIEARLKALGMGVEDPSILKNLGEGYIALQEWDRAYEWIEKHYTCLEESQQKVENRCLMALVVQAKGETEEAIRIYQQALQADPSWLPAIRGIADTYSMLEKWDMVVQAYQEFLQNLPEAMKMAGLPIHLALGNLYYERFGKRNEAIEEFKKALALDSTHIASHAALAAIESEDPAFYDEGIQEHTYLLKRDPLRTASYRCLYKIFQMKKQEDLAMRACQNIAISGELVEEEKEFMAKNSPQRPEHVNPESLLAYLVPNRSAAFYEILSLSSEHMARIYPADLETKYGLKRKDRILGDNVKIFSQVESIRKILGIPAIDLYINPKKTAQVFIENTQPASLILNMSLLESFSDEEICFLLAKFLFYIAQNQILTIKLEPQEIKTYFTMMRESFIGSEEKFAGEELALFKKIKNALPRKVRKTMEERPDLWETKGKEEGTHYLKDMDFASNRCGLLLSDSLEISVQAFYQFQLLLQTGKTQRTDKIPLQELAKYEAIHDLLLYNISDEYRNLRRSLGKG